MTTDTQKTIVHRLTAQEAIHDTPKEYQNAEVLPSVFEKFREKPISLLMFGPPGTGKTRQAWALRQHDRLMRAKDLIENGEECHASEYQDHHATWHDPVTRGQWVSEKQNGLDEGDRIAIVSEAGDIRRNRYKHEVVDEWIDWPHTLIVDDIGFCEPNEWVKECIYHLANERRAHSRRTIWTTNLDPDGLKAMFGAAIASRLMGGTILNLDGLDRRS